MRYCCPSHFLLGPSKYSSFSVLLIICRLLIFDTPVINMITDGNYSGGNWGFSQFAMYVTMRISSCIIFKRKIFNCDLQKVTFQKAREHSVKTARLPIQEYMVRRQNGKNYHSEILTINQGTARTGHAWHVVLALVLLCIAFKYEWPLKQFPLWLLLGFYRMPLWHVFQPLRGVLHFLPNSQLC